jgi:hypothetical protein
MTKLNQRFFDDRGNSRHPASSDPSSQSSWLSHLQALRMHVPLLHRNSPSKHSPGARVAEMDILRKKSQNLGFGKLTAVAFIASI